MTRSFRTTFVALVLVVAAATLVRADGEKFIKLDKLRDDFSGDAALRCEACAAVMHAAMVSIDRARAVKLATLGTRDIGEGEIDYEEVCAARFGAGTARYGFKMVQSAKWLVGPGVDALQSAPGDIFDRASATEQLLARCKALLYELDDYSMLETLVEAEEIAKKAGVSASAMPQKVFMRLMQQNCVERSAQCESVDRLTKSLTETLNEVAKEKQRAQSEIQEKVVTESTVDGNVKKQLDVDKAVSKCNGTDSDALSSAACSTLVQELISKGEQSSLTAQNFTGEAKKYEKSIAKGGERRLDSDDVDKDGDVHELYVDAMLNVSYIRANITLEHALRYFSLALDIDPKQTNARHNLAFVNRNLNNFAVAKEQLEYIISRADESAVEIRAESAKLLCEIEHLLGNTKVAMEMCTRSIELDPHNFHALRLKAQLHVVKFFDETEGILAKKDAPSDEEVQRVSALELKMAEQLFTQALVLNPVKNEIAQLGMVLYFEQAAQDAALHQLTKQQVEVLKNARHFCLHRGTELEAVCTDMLELAGNHMANKGFIAIGNDALQMALTIDGKRTNLWESLAYGFMAMGKFKMARISFDRRKAADASFELPDTITELLKRGYDFETKLEEDRATASTAWSENRRPNKEERAALEAEVSAKLGSLRPPRSRHDEL